MIAATQCYRNTMVELSPGRFSRDHWTVERFRLPDRTQNREQPGRKRMNAQGRPIIYAYTDCNPTSGYYEIIAHEADHRSGRALLARCGGKECGGHERRFTYAEWQTAAKACHRCATASRFDAGKVPPTSGAFKLISVRRDEERRVMVDGVCTGPGCNGTSRQTFRVDRWMRGLHRCIVCANVARRKYPLLVPGERR